MDVFVKTLLGVSIFLISIIALWQLSDSYKPTDVTGVEVTYENKSVDTLTVENKKKVDVTRIKYMRLVKIRD